MKTSAAVLTLLLSTPVLAAEQKPSAPAAPAADNSAQASAVPQAPRELESMKPLVGNFKCDGKAGGGATGVPAYDFKSTLATKLDLEGRWFIARHEEKKSKANPLGYQTTGFFGYDTVNKRFFRSFAGSDGSYESATSSGWQGDQMVWSGELIGQLGQDRLSFRHTYIRKSDREIHNTFEIQAGEHWVTWATEVCRK